MTLNFPLLKDAGNLRGKRVFLAIDLNVPIQDEKVVDDYRVQRSRATLKFLHNSGARTLLVSHRTEETASLHPVYEYLRKQYSVAFAKTLSDARTTLARAIDGSFTLLENIRKIGGKKERNNDAAFAEELASLADRYVNEAFSISHRAHASIIGVPKSLPSYAGFLFEEEVKNLSKAFSPEHPALVILGGAKFETKMPLIKTLLALADTVYLCGALANDVYKARGYEVGVSLVSETAPDAVLLENPKLQVPSDVIVRTAEDSKETGSSAVGKGEKIVDAGSDALADLRALIEKAKFVLWNGPLGEYEAGFNTGTVALAQMLAECDAETIIGGGDSLAVVSKLGLIERFSFVSTGGGAMLEFLATGTLPGIEALKTRN